MQFLRWAVVLVAAHAPHFNVAFVAPSVSAGPRPVLNHCGSSSTAIFQSSRSSIERLGKGTASLSPETPSASERLIASVQGDASSIESPVCAGGESSEEYKKGIAIISFITLLNASLAPVWHTVFAGGGPPPLFLNAVVSVTALVGLLAFGPFLDGKVETTSALAAKSEQQWSAKSFRGGIELGFWKGLGKACRRI